MTVELHTNEAPTRLRSRLSKVGPGLITAATGVGAGDLVAALVAGATLGMTFAWAIVVGAILKYYLNEGVGRWQLSTGQTILEGWNSMGKWATSYFGVYSVIWGFVFGAAVSSSCALAMHALFPQLPLWAWAIIHALIGFLLVWNGRYALVEKLMTVFVGIMFVTVVGTAILLSPNLTALAGGMVPKVPEGSLMNALALIGGVGGSITMASYGYWIREKGWNHRSWISIMRLDSAVAYIVTAIFTLSLLVVGAEFLFGTGITLSGEQGLIQLSSMLGERFNEPMRWLFLIGFWAASFTSLLGVWNGVPYLFADFVRIMKKEAKNPGVVVEKTKPYRAYLIWLTFPSMLLLFIGKPVGLIMAYGALGALFMPFLALSLLWLLNSKRVEKQYRNSLWNNIMLAVCILLFIVLMVNELLNIF
ncbi:Nramp family divalent metal transporter [Priestia flexa]|uniref:Nramp family divalent metal transporter n=1 Tax=Priestia flexa TaxID=86664 RepID=UPI0010FC1CD9|nr:Nramp family divalent metal transporter [Priestia flexa]QCS53417.1 divalent metal cation transporter [Priestia flexa]